MADEMYARETGSVTLTKGVSVFFHSLVHIIFRAVVPSQRNPISDGSLFVATFLCCWDYWKTLLSDIIEQIRFKFIFFFLSVTADCFKCVSKLFTWCCSVQVQVGVMVLTLPNLLQFLGMKCHKRPHASCDPKRRKLAVSQIPHLTFLNNFSCLLWILFFFTIFYIK